MPASSNSQFMHLNYILKPFTQSVELITSLPFIIKKRRKKERKKEYVDFKKLPKSLTEKQKEKSLKNSIKDGVSASVTAGVVDSYIAPYAIAMQASNIQIAMLTSIPNLIAPALQLQTPKRLEQAGRKKLIVRSVLFQALMLIPIALLSLLFLFKSTAKFVSYAPLMLVFFFTLYVIFGSLYGPAWASWIGDLVSEKHRYSFFAKRNIVCGAAALITTLLAGFFLDLWKKEAVYIGFIIIFMIAMVARLFSRYFLSKKYESKLKLEKGYYFSFFDFLKRMRYNNFGRFVIYIAAIIFATNIAGPFFAVYMLKDLNFSYTTFTIINISAAVTTLFAFRYWGNFSEKYGNIKIVKFCGLFLVPLLPILWIFSHNFWWLIFIQVLSGLTWAGFNLAAGNFVYDTVTPQRRSLCVAYQNVINGLAVFSGATIGGLIATHVNVGINVLLFVFFISGILRFIFSVFMLPQIKEVKKLANGTIVTITD